MVFKDLLGMFITCFAEMIRFDEDFWEENGLVRFNHHLDDNI